MPEKRSRNKHAQARSADTPLLRKIILSALRASFTAALTSLFLALAICALVLRAPDPTALLTPLALVALYISSLAGGFFSVRDRSDSPIVCGAASGILFMLLSSLASLFFPTELDSGRTFLTSALLHALIILFFCLGAYASVKMKKSKKRKRR